MIKSIFILHSTKSFLRNGKLRKHFLSYGFSILGIYLIFRILLFFGLHLKEILLEIGSDPISEFNSLILFYLIIDLVLRVFLKPSLIFSLNPYLRLPISQSKIVNFMLLRNIFDIFNLISMFLIIPFSWNVVYSLMGFKSAIWYQSILTFLIFSNCYLATYLRLLIQSRIYYYSIPFALIILLFIKQARVLLHSFSYNIGLLISNRNFSLFILIVIYFILIVIFLRYKYLTCFYIDANFNRLNIKLNKKLNNIHFGSKQGIFSYLLLEIKLIIRNRRPLQTIGIYPFFPVIIMANLITRHLSNFILVLSLMFILGLFPILYGQNIFSWESSFFDGKMARERKTCDYLYAKYYLLFVFSFAIFIVVVPFFICFGKPISLFIVLFLFVNGVINFFVLLFGVFNRYRINLREHIFINYHGYNAIQLSLPIFVLILPTVLFDFICKYIGLNMCLLIFSILGILFIFLHKIWIRKIILPLFQRRKYVNLEGFRKLEI
ncbi:MAG: DUF5687 family protein [Bacteroidales bacterium]|jgi:hypothetical protein